MSMDPAVASVKQLAGRLAGLAALCVGFSVGTVRVSRTGEPVLRHSERFPSDALAAAAERLDEDVIERGLPRAVEDLVIENATGAGEPAGDPPAPSSGSYAGVPVWSGGRVVGVISVSEPAPRTVTRQHLRILVGFAELLGEQLASSLDRTEEGVDDAVQEVTAALRAGELRPWYQPIVDLATGTVVAVEALARWHRPGGAVEGPATFLPVAERSDLVLEVDRAILSQALADLHGWQQEHPELRVSVNLSGRHLDSSEVVAMVDGAVAAAGVSPGTIDLEVTETARPTDLTTGRIVLEQLRDRGYTVWFDDFGSGWSALQDLISMPVGGFKLDRSFAEHLGTPVDDAVIDALTTAADQVGLRVVIEGIEEPDQADRARELGCHFGQGFHYASPAPASDVPAMITALSRG